MSEKMRTPQEVLEHYRSVNIDAATLHARSVKARGGSSNEEGPLDPSMIIFGIVAVLCILAIAGILIYASANGIRL